MRQTRQQRQQQRINQAEGSKPAAETVQLSLLELQIPAPRPTTSTTVQNSRQPTLASRAKSQGKDFPVAVSIRELLQEMDSKGRQTSDA